MLQTLVEKNLHYSELRVLRTCTGLWRLQYEHNHSNGTSTHTCDIGTLLSHFLLWYLIKIFIRECFLAIEKNMWCESMEVWSFEKSISYFSNHSNEIDLMPPLSIEFLSSIRSSSVLALLNKCIGIGSARSHLQKKRIIHLWHFIPTMCHPLILSGSWYKNWLIQLSLDSQHTTLTPMGAPQVNWSWLQRFRWPRRQITYIHRGGFLLQYSWCTLLWRALLISLRSLHCIDTKDCGTKWQLLDRPCNQ